VSSLGVITFLPIHFLNCILGLAEMSVIFLLENVNVQADRQADRQTDQGSAAGGGEKV
jgi:hypothetical protein